MTTRHGAVYPVGNLPDSWGPVTTMNLNNYRTTVVTLTTCLLFAFGWLMGDAEWAMGSSAAPMAANRGISSTAAGA